jgi:hypothetical protein
MTGPVIYAAAYLLLTHPASATNVVRPPAQPVAVRPLDCPANHLTVRWIGDRHRHHRHHHTYHRR